MMKRSMTLKTLTSRLLPMISTLTMKKTNSITNGRGGGKWMKYITQGPAEPN
jgi:hypothetical protein